MVSMFLNEPSLEAARDAYLKRWHLESVRSAWNGRKPTQAQFNKRFKDAYEKRQKYLARTGQGTSATAIAVDEREDALQQSIENLLALAGHEVEDEPEVENLGSDVPTTTVGALLAKLRGHTPDVPAKAEKPVEKFVKPENFSEFPRNAQLYFFLHRAKEAGLDYAIIPLKRGVAAEVISQIKDDGRSYTDVASDLVTA